MDELQQYYAPWQIGVATLLGGPVAGGFLSFRDHVLFGNGRKGKVILLVSCGVFIALAVVGSLLPAKSSTTPIAAAVAGMYRWHAAATFGPEIARRSAEGWVRYSWWRAIGWGAAFLAALLIFLAAPVIVITEKS